MKLFDDRKRQITFFGLLLVGIVIIYVISFLILKEYKIREKNVSRVSEVLTVVEDVEIVNDELILSGWITKFGASNREIVVILREEDTSENIKLSTKEKTLKNTKVLDAGGDKDKGGFVASVPIKQLNEESCYEILVYLSYEEAGNFSVVNNVKVRSGFYLYKGEIYQYDPRNITTPVIEDDELLQVITEGILRAYDATEKIWIYEYQNQLYYIVDFGKGHLSENHTNFSVMFYTWQKDLLSEEGKAYGFDHKGYYAEESRYVKDGILPYQVAVVPIDEQYQVTNIATGLYNHSQNKWIKEFNIYRVKELYMENSVD